ncbi:hypothetical protein AMJ47_02355 [Parcubacteria bacterium DG_72]|nr:MAG: hypothetical protein AMJ47_02355 [Parcubacteria bacterium DG_72]
MAKVYNVHLVAEDAEGKEVKLEEVVAYPERPATVAGAVPEGEREARGVMQAQHRRPDLKNIRAKWSRHV